MVKAPATVSPHQQNQNLEQQQTYFFQSGNIKKNCRSQMAAEPPGGGVITTSIPTTSTTAIAIVAPTARSTPATASTSTSSTSSTSGQSLQSIGLNHAMKPPQLQQRLQPLHHIHHHHQLIAAANGLTAVAGNGATIATPLTAATHTSWPIVEPVFHFGPGFEPQTRPYCPTHSQGPQPSEHVVFFHVNPGVSVTFQIAGNREIIRGPVTVPMVSQSGSPPIAMPVQVPPGHVMQQIVDENGTLRHVILSTAQHQQIHGGQPGVQHHIHGHYITNSTTPHYYNPLAAGYPAGPGPGGPPHFHPGTIPPGAGGGTHALHTPQQMPHSPSPPHNNYHKDERTQRQHSKLLRKLDQQKQREMNSTLSTPVNSPRKNTELNGNLRRNHPPPHQPQRNGVSSVGTSEDGEESSSVPDDEDDTQLIVEHLSSVQSPQISEITSRSALLQWTTPTPLGGADNLPFNSRDLRYEVLLSDRGKENKYKSIFKGPSLSCKIQDLRPGQEYSVCLQIHLDELLGSPTDPSVFTTPPCEPDAPIAPKLLARTKTSLQLRWNAPVDNGSHIIHYILEYDNGKYGGNINLVNQQQNCDFIEISKTKSKQSTVTKLHPSTYYIFRLLAVNEFGRSGYSDFIKYFTAGHLPSQPPPPQLQNSTSTSLRLAWHRKSHDEDYILQMNDLELGYGFRNMYTGTENIYECTGLRRATTFQFRLRADNENGSSPWSEEVVFRTHPECPGRPSKPQIKGRIHATNFKVKWEPPLDSGGAVIKLYHLEINSGSSYERIYTGKEAETLCDRLSPGTTYQIRVLCEGPGGISMYSDPCTVTTEPVTPSQPQKPYCPNPPNPYAALLKWEKPDYNGGSPVLEYEMEVETNKVRNSIYKGKDMFCVVKDLLPGELYSVQVRAINRIGAGQWSEEYSFNAGATAPNAPTAVKTTIKSPTHLTVCWDEPHCNGSQITEYQVESSTDEITNEKVFHNIYNGLQPTADVRNLLPYTTYYFRIFAANAAGKSPFSPIVSQMTPCAPPNVPQLNEYDITAKTILISWDTPFANGSTIRHYNIECGDRLLSTSENVLASEITEMSSSNQDEAVANLLESSSNQNISDKNEFLIDDLQPETTYKLRIQAVNDIGTGAFSNYIKFTTAPLPPKPPKLECSQIGFAHLKLKWGEGKNLDLARYYVEMQHNRTKEYQNVYTGTRATCKVTKLHELTSYSFRICVETKHAGMGDYSEDFILTTTAATPNSVKAPRVHIEANHSPQHPSSTNGTLTVTATGTTTVENLSTSSIHNNHLTIEWQSSRNNPFTDTIEYILQYCKTKDQDYQEIYHGPDTRFTVEKLEFGTSYSFKVCPVRIRSTGEQILGQYSSVLNHQVTFINCASSGSSNSSGSRTALDEIDSRTTFEGNMIINRRGELILSHASLVNAGNNSVALAGVAYNSSTNSYINYLTGGNKNNFLHKLLDKLSTLLDTDFSKAVCSVAISFLLSITLAAIIQNI